MGRRFEIWRPNLAQAEALIRRLAEDRPYALSEADATAMDSGRKWRTALKKSLAHRPEIAELLKGL